METHAAGGTQGGQDGREDADEGLENELPDGLFGITGGLFTGNYGFHFGNYNFVIVDGLLDSFLHKLLKDFLK